MFLKSFSALFLAVSLIACNAQSQTEAEEETNAIDAFFNANPTAVSDGFDFPVGKPNAKGYYNAQKFTENNHLGDDWNGTGGGNTDLGDPIYAAANGYVRQVIDEGPSWGNVIRIVHKLPNGKYVESLYAHCKEMLVKEGQSIKRGAKIATIGNADGAYYAHLHLEIRTDIDLPLGGGYSANTMGYIDPTAFIKANRP